MKQRLVVTLVVGLLALGCGGGVAQSPVPQGTPPTQGAQPVQSSAPSPEATQAAASHQPSPEATMAAASYQPSPAADPAAAVNAALDALVAKNWAALPGLVCAAERASIADHYDLAVQTYYPQEATQALVDALAIQVANRSVALTSSTTETATVKLGGTLTEEVSDDALLAFVAALAKGASPEPTRDQLDRASKMFKASISSITLAPEVRVVAEGGGWLLCSDLVTTGQVPSGSAVQGSPEPSPAVTAAASIVPVPAPDPVAAVNAVLDALIARQWDTIPALMCADLRASGTEFSASLGGPEGKQLLDAMTIDFANRDVTLAGTIVTGVPWQASATRAIVNVAGQLALQIPDAAIRGLVNQIAAAASESPDPSAVGQQVADVQGLLRSLSIASKITVANESGGWLVCSSVILADNAPSPSPSPAGS
jgi:hypothetical protein